VADALSDRFYREKLPAAGFEAIDTESTCVHNVDGAWEFLSAAGIDANITCATSIRMVVETGNRLESTWGPVAQLDRASAF
jgi:hypothetical protein